MPSITEGKLTFDFQAGWRVTKLDEWSYYRNQFQRISSGTKAIDILAIDAGQQCFWCIEIKDYRRNRRTKLEDVVDETARKVRDSLAVIAGAIANANDDEEKSLAKLALGSNRSRVVLHLEQPARHSKLFPRTIDRANTQEKLRQRMKAVDPHLLVREMSDMSGCPWTVRETSRP